jgi:hypothetical protein
LDFKVLLHILKLLGKKIQPKSGQIYSSANGLHDQLLDFKVLLHIQKLLGKEIQPKIKHKNVGYLPTEACFQKPGLVVRSLGPFSERPLSKDFT